MTDVKVKQKTGYVSSLCEYVGCYFAKTKQIAIYGSWIIYNDFDALFLLFFFFLTCGQSTSNDSIFFLFQSFSVNKQNTISSGFLVLLLALHSLHVVVHVHKPAQPGSVEGSITAWWVHAHLLLVAIPFLNVNASCLRLCVCGCGCLQNGGFWVI